MAIIKKHEFKTMDGKVLNTKLTELEMELMKLNAKVAVGTNPENPIKIRVVKRTIAKILTKLNTKNKEVVNK